MREIDISMMFYRCCNLCFYGTTSSNGEWTCGNPCHKIECNQDYRICYTPDARKIGGYQRANKAKKFIQELAVGDDV